MMATSPTRPTPTAFSPFVEIERADWAGRASKAPLRLTEADVQRVRGLGDPVDITEVREVYLPLSRLLNLHVASTRGLHRALSTFLGDEGRPTPFVIGIAGSVAVGKSTVARLLRELLRRWDDTPRVELVTTDGFLYPNEDLQRRGLMQRKGFPESYDQRALLRFVTRVKSGVDEVRSPFYSHVAYDIVPDAEIVVHRPDILIVEGLNVLQPPRSSHSLAVSDMFDFSIYVDARTRDIRQWYEDRFLRLQRNAFSTPGAYFRKYADLDEATAREQARSIWDSINGPNLEANILPTRSRARLVLRKDADHSVNSVLLRKL